jgi:hypothetical protein
MTSKTSTPETIQYNVGGTGPGSHNVELDRQNPDMLRPSQRIICRLGNNNREQCLLVASPS